MRYVVNEDVYDVEVGDYVYYARALDSLNIFEVVEYKVRTVDADYFAGLSMDSSATLFSPSDIGKTVFFNQKDAQDVVNTRKDKGLRIDKVEEE